MRLCSTILVPRRLKALLSVVTNRGFEVLCRYRETLVPVHDGRTMVPYADNPGHRPPVRRQRRPPPRYG